MAKLPKLPKAMLEQLQLLQQLLLSAQAELADVTVTGTSGKGAVKVTLTGDQRCVEMSIDPELLKEQDAEMLQDLVMTAMNKALEESRNMAAERLTPLSPDLGEIDPE